VRKALNFMMEIAPKVQQTGMNLPSYLELASVDKPSLKQYLVRLGVLSHSGDFSTLKGEALDKQFVIWMNRTFAAGLKAWAGEKALAALMLFAPEAIQPGIPRSVRALRGWRKMSPGFSKRPRNWAIWCGLATKMIRQGHWRKGVGTLLAVVLYLRMKELVGLKCGNFLGPTEQGVRYHCIRLHPLEEGMASKTGKLDENLDLSSPLALQLVPAVKTLMRRPCDETVLGCDYLEYYRVFRAAGQALGIAEVVPSEASPSGPSIDLAFKYKTLPEVQKLGRWAAPASVKRYEKSGELNRTWNALSEEQQRHFRDCQQNLATTVLGTTFPKDFVDVKGSASSQRRVPFSAQAGTASATSKRRRTFH
jgi:hypothetical protein